MRVTFAVAITALLALTVRATGSDKKQDADVSPEAQHEKEEVRFAMRERNTDPSRSKLLAVLRKGAAALAESEKTPGARVLQAADDDSSGPVASFHEIIGPHRVLLARVDGSTVPGERYAGVFLPIYFTPNADSVYVVGMTSGNQYNLIGDVVGTVEFEELDLRVSNIDASCSHLRLVLGPNTRTVGSVSYLFERSRLDISGTAMEGKLVQDLLCSINAVVNSPSGLPPSTLALAELLNQLNFALQGLLMAVA